MAKLNFKQLQNKGIFLKYQGDADKDGIANIKDCKPLDPHKQGIIHEWIKKREKNMDKELAKKNKTLEKQQDKLLAQADNEKTKLQKYQLIEKKILENKKKLQY